jgi:hypothetical protein
VGDLEVENPGLGGAVAIPVVRGPVSWAAVVRRPVVGIAAVRTPVVPVGFARRHEDVLRAVVAVDECPLHAEDALDFLLDGIGDVRVALGRRPVVRLDPELEERRLVGERRAELVVAGRIGVDGAEDPADGLGDPDVDAPVQEVALPHHGVVGRTGERDHVVVSRLREDRGDRGVRDALADARVGPRRGRLVVDADDVGRPVVLDREVRQRLLQDVAVGRRLDLEHAVGDAAAQRPGGPDLVVADQSVCPEEVDRARLRQFRRHCRQRATARY